MRNRFLLLALAAGAALTGMAQTPLTVRQYQSADNVLAGRKGKTVINHNPSGLFSANGIHRAKSVITAGAVKAGEGENPYGQEVDIMYEDFSKMSSGSFDAPDLNTDINYIYPGECEYPWWNLNSDYTKLPNWGSHGGYSAGGMIYFTPEPDGAHLNTPLLDLKARCGIAVLSFRARTADGTTADGMAVEVAETFNMGPTWEVLGVVGMPEITDEWRTFEVTVQGCGGTTLFNILMNPTNPIYIDDVRVYQIDQYVNTPVTLAHTQYTGKSFNANWEAVENADGYMINVFSVSEEGEVTYLLKDQKAEGTSFKVEGIESGKTYYYTLRATKGDKQSIETMPVEVYDLEAPVLNDVDGVRDGKYTASWNAVPTAERYNYWAYDVRVAGEDGEFTVTDENFDDIRDAYGELTGLTLEDPSYNVYEELYLDGRDQAGWKGLWYMPYTDYVCVDAWHYLNGQGNAGIVSPELDLSKDGGKVSLSVKLCGEVATMWDMDDNPIPVQTECAVALFNYDETVGDYVQDELVYPEGVTEAWKTFDVTLTKGTKRSIIGVYGVKAPGNLYIDDLKIKQNYKKGETLSEPFLFEQWVEGTSVDVTVPAKIAGAEISHKVSAVKSRPGEEGKASFKESLFSDTKIVCEAASIGGDMLRENVSVTAQGDVIRITNPNGECVAVYAVDGTQVLNDETGAANIVVRPSVRGIYIVKVGSAVVKVRN